MIADVSGTGGDDARAAETALAERPERRLPVVLGTGASTSPTVPRGGATPVFAAR